MQPLIKVWMVRAALVLLMGLLLVSSDPKVIKRPVPKASKCADRPEELLEQLYGRLAAGMLSAYHHTLQLQPLDKLNISCPAGNRGRGLTENKQRLPVNIHSISPWAYRITYNPTRYPKYIPEAYCLCKGCLTGPYGEEDFHFRSTPVYMPTVILRRTPACAGGRYIYVEDYITIPVGCTCVPEQKETEPESVNSSLEKEKFKHINKSEKPLSN
ncbi:interleukin-17D isoform X2 [Bombina bombina]|uniref:interleukin-17D isoform X2 n=1 Tax=Bombina bombina TaxID=8345 RepID=UPI00235B250E|nr:interleukin-17D isoform X2 [Bombina bombina]